IVPRGLVMQVTAKLEKEFARRFKLGKRRRSPETIGGRILDLAQPAQQLVIAQSAGRLLDVGLEVVNRVVEFEPAIAGQDGQVAGEALALSVHRAGALPVQ